MSDGIEPRKKQLKQPTFRGSKRVINIDQDHLVSVFENALKGQTFKDLKLEDKPEADMIKWPTGMDPSRAGVSDLCDFFLGTADDLASKKAHDVKVLQPIFKDYGGLASFCGRVTTIKTFQSNPLVRKTLNEDGTGRVLVIDGGASLNCALVGDRLAEHGADRGWSGIIINGCVRDTSEVCTFNIGIKAIASHPLKPGKRDLGQRDVPVSVGGVVINPGDWIYADSDGVIVSPTELKLPEGGPPAGKQALTIPE